MDGWLTFSYELLGWSESIFNEWDEIISTKWGGLPKIYICVDETFSDFIGRFSEIANASFTLGESIP